MKRPNVVIYVAETLCCGLRIHAPHELGKPAHFRVGGQGHEPCKIVRYWEFRAKRRPMTDTALAKLETKT